MAKTFLFLQGPHGPFFRQLGRRLRRMSRNRVVRINFNGGDWIDWCGRGVLNFTGTQQEWPQYVADVMRKEEVTDLVVYGDCRIIHAEAIDVAQQRNIRVHVFEEGYIRPNWITLERDGVNGKSSFYPLAAKLLQEHELKEDREPKETPKVGPSMRWLVFYCLRHYLFKSLLSKRFKNYIRHRPYRAFQELFLWCGNLLHLPLLRYRSNKRTRWLFNTNKSFYLACLQLDSDAQLHAHSPFLSMAEFVNQTLRSFAQYAPSDAVLVFKKHPYDPGAIPYETLIRLEAYSLGIRERILFLHCGSLPELIKRSEGVVLMNSTVGTSAVHHGKPTIAMGKAIFDLPGLSWQGGLDRFWTEAHPPDPVLYRKFRALLFKKTLIHGGFYSRQGRIFALRNSLRRLGRSESQGEESAQLDTATLQHEDMLLSCNYHGRY